MRTRAVRVAERGSAAVLGAAEAPDDRALAQLPHSDLGNPRRRWVVIRAAQPCGNRLASGPDLPGAYSIASGSAHIHRC